MEVKIAIIGLGQIGASIGLALANHKDQVTTIGYDTAGEVNRKAKKMGAVEMVGHSLSASVKDADMIFLALPLDQIHETIQSIAGDIRAEAVVVDTAPVKEAVAAWAKELLPPGRRYVGLTMVLNPLLMDETGTGIDSARADLFHNGLAAITTPPGTAGEVIQLVASFVTLLGARAYFADQAEVDGFMATVQTLPALAAAALAETVFDQPSWGDIRKLAGRPFIAAMRPLEEAGAAALAETVHRNRVNTVRVLDEYIVTLKSMRDEIDGEEQKNLRERLEHILDARAQWLRLRADGDWKSIESLEVEIPTINELWKQQLGLGKLFGRRKKNEKGDQL